MRHLAPLFLLFFITVLSGCPFFEGSIPGVGSGSESVTHKEKDVSGKLALSSGGEPKGADEIVLDENVQLLELQNNDPDLFSLEVRPGFDSFTSGKGAKVVPQRVGIGFVTPILSGRSRDPIQITIPPQKLIQILIGEARGELDREATLEGNQVKDSSVSVTGDALGAVVRNRIKLINQMQKPGLFEADPVAYEKDPPISYYESVIGANKGTNYQFLPVDPKDLSNPYYLGAEHRNTVGSTNLTAYDQAVLTAAGIFNEGTGDPTGGAFAFYSPSASEYKVLKEALEMQSLQLPAGAGKSDDQFPTLAPIQILILSEVAPSATHKETLSFVFVRSRTNLDPAVTDKP